MTEMDERPSDAEIALQREQTLRIALTTRVGELQEEVARWEGRVQAAQRVVDSWTEWLEDDKREEIRAALEG